MRISRRWFVLLAMLPWVAVATLEAAPKKPPKTAQPPKWEDVEDRVFFKDAFSKLVGERPDYKQLAKQQATGKSTTPGGTPTAGAAWSKLVSRETLEDEVKSFVPQLAADINVPAKFAAGGYRKARRHFTSLAAVFGVIAQYDADVRWKPQAAGLRDNFARAGFNAKAGSINVYNEAKARRDELTDLVRGSSVTVPDAPPTTSWSKIADQAPLMSRFELAFEKRLQAWVSNEKQFKSNLAGIKHEAEMLAMLGRVIQQDGFELADDEDYIKFARQLETAASDLAQATTTGSYTTAQKAAGRIQLSCTNCHGDFR
jgi:hypothetical protein